MEQELKPTEPQEQRMGFFARISGIFFEPKKVFNFLNSKPSWLFAFILILIISIIIAEIILPQSLLSQKEIVSQSPRLASSPETLERMTQVTTGARISTAIGEVFKVFLIELILLSALVYFFCNILLGGESGFKKVLSVVTYTYFVPTLGGILKTPLILAKNSADVQTSLALLMPEGDFTRISYMLLSALDLFSIWQLILIALGITFLYKFSMTKALIATFIGWAILVFIGVGLGVLGMSVSGIPVTW